MIEERGGLDLSDYSLFQIQLFDLPFLDSLERAKETQPSLSSQVYHAVVSLSELANDLKVLELKTASEMLFFMVDFHLDVLAEQSVFLDVLMDETIVLFANHCLQMLHFKSLHHQFSPELVLLKRAALQLAYPKALSLLHLLDEPAILFSFLGELLLQLLDALS